MKKIIATLAFITCATGPVFADGNMGILRGHVVHIGNEWKGFSDARVHASGASGDFQTSVSPSGFFVFMSLPPGRYSVYPDQSGYEYNLQCGVAVGANGVTELVKPLFLASMTIDFFACSSQEHLPNPGETSDVYDVF